MGSMIKWYKFLRAKGYKPIISFECAWYNSKYWTTEGEWPYGMKLK